MMQGHGDHSPWQPPTASEQQCKAECSRQSLTVGLSAAFVCDSVGNSRCNISISSSDPNLGRSSILGVANVQSFDTELTVGISTLATFDIVSYTLLLCRLCTAAPSVQRITGMFEFGSVGLSQTSRCQTLGLLRLLISH